MSDDLRLDGHVCVVTGAAGGIGRAEAVTLAHRGARVLCVDVADTAHVLAEIHDAGGAAHGWHGDLTEPGAPEDVLRTAVERFGDVTALVNNAGVVQDRMIFNVDDDGWERVLAVNLTGPFRLCRAVARHWRAGPPPAVGRRIVNTSSESGLYGNAGQTNYAAAKAGITGLTLTLAAGLSRLGVSVNAVAPRARTPMSRAAFGDLLPPADGDPLDPGHVATFVGWLLAPAADDVTGQVFVVSGAGVQWMRGWSVRRRAPVSPPPPNLRHMLFHGEDPHNVPGPISALFTHHDETEGAGHGIH